MTACTPDQVTRRHIAGKQQQAAAPAGAHSHAAEQLSGQHHLVLCYLGTTIF